MIAPNDPIDSGAALLRDLALRANRGIRLTRTADGRLEAHPLGPDGRPDPGGEAADVPPVPVRVLERGAGFLRHVWRARRTSAVWWLYLHPGRRAWSAFAPPQLCAEREVHVDPSFKDCETPDPDSWLAGSLRSAPPEPVGAATAEVGPLLPAHHGVHFVLDLGRPLTCLTPYLRTDRGVAAAPEPHGLFDDPLDPALAYLSDRLMFLTKATS